MNKRIVNGAKYFYQMKPSDFIIAGNVHPSKWRHLMELLKLILEEDNKAE